MEERLKIEHQPDRQCTTTAIVGAREIDPVCGMRLDPATLKHYFDIAGRRFHFCSADCRAKFEADPNAYHKRKAATSHPAKAGVTYTCPMHPQIRMEGPGNCPICGMTLESLTASGAAAPNSEVADMTRRFWIALALTLPVFVLEMGSHIPGLGLNAIIPPFISSWVQFGLATPVVLWAGWPFFQRGWVSLISRHLNMFTLISLGTGTAYIYSLAATFVPSHFPAAFRKI
jgi:Cu+-exporting ATPase